MTYEQTAESCIINSDYSSIKGNISEWEYSSETSAYYKNGKLFFASLKYENAINFGEIDYFFDENGKIIKITHRSSEEEDELQNISKSKVEGKEKTDSYLKNLNTELNKIDEILN